MEIILKHLSGAEQYLFLQGLFEMTGTFADNPLKYQKMPEVIQKIMDEVNK